MLREVLANVELQNGDVVYLHLAPYESIDAISPFRKSKGEYKNFEVINSVYTTITAAAATCNKQTASPIR